MKILLSYHIEATNKDYTAYNISFIFMVPQGSNMECLFPNNHVAVKYIWHVGS